MRLVKILLRIYNSKVSVFVKSLKTDLFAADFVIKYHKGDRFAEAKPYRNKKGNIRFGGSYRKRRIIMGNIIEIKVSTFEAEVIKSDKPVLVDFWASWCGPCHAMAPVIEELAESYDGRVAFGKVNVDDEGPLAQRYGIMSIPTIMLFKNGEAVASAVGVQPMERLEDMIDKNL